MTLIPSRNETWSLVVTRVYSGTQNISLLLLPSPLPLFQLFDITLPFHSYPQLLYLWYCIPFMLDFSVDDVVLGALVNQYKSKPRPELLFSNGSRHLTLWDVDN